VSPLEACEVTDVWSLAVAPEAVWVALLMSLMHMQPAQFPLSRTLFCFSVASNSQNSFHSAAPHVSPTPCCLFRFKSSILLTESAMFLPEADVGFGKSEVKCRQGLRFREEHDQMKDVESHQ